MISKRNCIQSDVWEKLKTLLTRSCFWRTLPLSPARSCTSTVARAPVTDQNGVAVLPQHTSSRWGRTTQSDPNAVVANLSPPVWLWKYRRTQVFQSNRYFTNRAFGLDCLASLPWAGTPSGRRRGPLVGSRCRGRPGRDATRGECQWAEILGACLRLKRNGQRLGGVINAGSSYSGSEKGTTRRHYGPRFLAGVGRTVLHYGAGRPRCACHQDREVWHR